MERGTVSADGLDILDEVLDTYKDLSDTERDGLFYYWEHRRFPGEITGETKTKLSKLVYKLPAPGELYEDLPDEAKALVHYWIRGVFPENFERDDQYRLLRLGYEFAYSSGQRYKLLLPVVVGLVLQYLYTWQQPGWERYE